jgi:hypothetical protein
VATAELVRSEAGRELDITLARVPTLADGKGGSLKVDFIGGNDQVRIIVQSPTSIIEPKLNTYACM